MPQPTHGSIEFLKFPNPQHPGDASQKIKKWLRDSWSRRKIVALQGEVATLQGQVATLQSNYTTLEARVSALEGNNT